MGLYKEGLHRRQQLMFPPSLDELVDENILNISQLNIKTKKSLIKDGQPAFHPKLLLKIYIYGYLNKIRSSRKLETEIISRLYVDTVKTFIFLEYFHQYLLILQIPYLQYHFVSSMA